MLAAAALQAADPAGHYLLQGVREVGSELLLKPDGNFEFMLAYGAADFWAKGSWRKDNGSVVLNSAGRREEPFRLLRSAPGKAVGTRVRVVAKNGRPVEHIDVALQTGEGVFEGRTDSDGVALIPQARQAKAAVLRVRVYSVESEPFELNPAHNEVSFEIDGDAITQVLFQDERLALEGTSLVMRFFDKERPMRYEKQ
jgi:hypothetical protein